MGVVAAQAAGMPVVALTTSFSAAHFEPAGGTADDGLPPTSTNSSD